MEVKSSTTPTADPEAKAKMEKLRLEVAELQWKVRWSYKVGQFVSIATAFLAIGAILVSIYQIDSSYQQDFKKPLWEKQLDLLSEVSNSAAAIAVLPLGHEKRKDAEFRFKQLYLGPVILTQDDVSRPLQTEGLKCKMQTFLLCLDGALPECNCHEVNEDNGDDGNEANDCYERSKKLKDLSLEISELSRVTVDSIWNIRRPSPTPDPGCTAKPATESAPTDLP